MPDLVSSRNFFRTEKLLSRIKQALRVHFSWHFFKLSRRMEVAFEEVELGLPLSESTNTEDFVAVFQEIDNDVPCESFQSG